MFKTLISSNIEEAVSHLKQGTPVPFPTETVYGLGAGVFDEKALLEVFRLKGRPSDNPLIVHLSDIDMVQMVAEDIPDDFYLLAEHFMPGPLAVILKKKNSVPSIVSAGLNTIAVRIPSHETARALIRAYGSPIAAPSANLSGRPSATSAAHVLHDFSGKIPFILDGGVCTVGIESTVVYLLEDKAVILRPGCITQEQIEKVLKKPVVFKSDLEGVRSPGTRYPHYAPRAQMQVFYSLKDLNRYALDPKLSYFLLTPEPMVYQGIESKILTEESFYESLREADSLHTDVILVLVDETILEREGLMNRLQKAAGLT